MSESIKQRTGALSINRDHIQLKKLYDAILTDITALLSLVNNLRSCLTGDNLITQPVLAIGSTTHEFSFGGFSFRVNGVPEDKALDATIAFTANNTINTGAAAGKLWGAWRVQIAKGGTVTTSSVGADQVYATEAAAIAALPAVTADNADMGYITVQAKSGADWVMNTDDLTAASDCEGAFFYDADIGVEAAAVGTLVE